MKPSLKGKLFLVLICIAAYSCNTTTGGFDSLRTAPKSPEQLRQELAVQEQLAPVRYLSAQATIQENQVLVQKADFFHHSKYATDGWIVTGTVKNTASVAKFKDAVLRIRVLSETQTVMETKQIVLYKYFVPGTVIQFEEKLYPPVGMKNFNIQVSSAIPIN